MGHHIGMGLGRGGLIQLDGEPVDAVKARHQESAPDQGGEWFGGVAFRRDAGTLRRCHHFTLRVGGVAAGTLIAMDTDVVEHSGTDVAPGRTPEATIDEVDHLLDEVEAALTRLDEGTYGTCSGCGVAIEDDRLSVDPTIRTCGSCGVDGSFAENSVDGDVDPTSDQADEAVTGWDAGARPGAAVSSWAGRETSAD